MKPFGAAMRATMACRDLEGWLPVGTKITIVAVEADGSGGITTNDDPMRAVAVLMQHGPKCSLWSGPKPEKRPRKAVKK